LLQELLFHNIYKIKHITLPNGTNLMSSKEFKIYYQTPTKIKKRALNIAEQFFCYPRSTFECSNPCQRHPTTQTFKAQYISNNRALISRTSNNPPYPPLPQLLQLPQHTIKKNVILLMFSSFFVTHFSGCPIKHLVFLCQQ